MTGAVLPGDGPRKINPVYTNKTHTSHPATPPSPCECRFAALPMPVPTSIAVVSRSRSVHCPLTVVPMNAAVRLSSAWIGSHSSRTGTGFDRVDLQRNRNLKYLELMKILENRWYEANNRSFRGLKRSEVGGGREAAEVGWGHGRGSAVFLASFQVV